MRVVNVLALVLCLLAMQMLQCAGTCRGPRPKFFAIAGDRRSYRTNHGNILEAQYGDRLDIFCSGTDSKNLSIKLSGIFPKTVSPGKHLTKVANATTLQMTIEQPGIANYHYNCTDVNTGCIDNLNVRVRPIMALKSRHIHQKVIEDSVHYYVPIGEDYEVICSGGTEISFAEGIYGLTDKTITNISVNETTVKSLQLRLDRFLEGEYRCYAGDMSDDIYVKLPVYIDFHPAAKNFWCVKYGWQFDCSWAVTGTNTVFTLFFKGPYGNSLRVYEDHVWREYTRHSEWNIKELRAQGIQLKDNFTLVMQACNMIYCQNQTFLMNVDSIRKEQSPGNLRLLNKSSHDVTLSWNEHSVDIPVQYKVTYRLPGTPTQLPNASSLQVTCKSLRMSFLRFYNKYCVAKLRLPCPGSFYVIEVYAKLTNTPTNEAYWSKPASITFWTKPLNSTDAVDPACVKEPELIDNKYVAVSEVKKLERSFHKDGLALRRKVISMERKIVKIKELCHQLALDDCEHFGLRTVP